MRYQEERPGRLREYYEMGAELLGAPGADADEEMLDLFLRVLQLRDGVKVRVVVGFAGALDRLLLECPAEGRAALLRSIARRDRRAARQAGAALLRVVEDGAPAAAADLGDESAPRLERLRALIERVERRFDRERVSLSIDLAEFAEDTLDPELQGGDRDRALLRRPDVPRLRRRHGAHRRARRPLRSSVPAARRRSRRGRVLGEPRSVAGGRAVRAHRRGGDLPER